MTASSLAMEMSSMSLDDGKEDVDDSDILRNLLSRKSARASTPPVDEDRPRCSSSVQRRMVWSMLELSRHGGDPTPPPPPFCRPRPPL